MLLSTKYKWTTRILSAGLMMAAWVSYGTTLFSWFAAAAALSLVLLAGDLYNLVLSGLMTLSYASKFWNNIVVRVLIFLGLIVITFGSFSLVFGTGVFLRFLGLIGGLIGGGLLVVIGIFWHQYWYVSPNRED